MRQINTILSGLLALSLGFAGCSSEEPISSNGTTSGTSNTGTPVAFRVAFNTEGNSEMKKLAYEGGDRSNPTTAIAWTANDRILVYSSSSEDHSPVNGVYATDAMTSPAEFAYVAELGSTEITWGDFSPAQQFQAFYPANEVGDAITTGFPDGKAQFIVPAKQYPKEENNYGMNNVLLYAATSATSQSDNVSFLFDNVVTVLELTVPSGNDKAIDRIEVRAKGANAGKLAGTFTAKTAGANPATGFSDATFDITDPMSVVTVYPPTENWTDGTLYIALAPYAYDGLAVTLVGPNGTDRIAKIASQEGTNVVSGHKLYPIKKASLNWKENMVDLGLQVVSDMVNGAIMTRVVGYFDGANSRAWKICDAKADMNPADYEAAMLSGAVPLANRLTGSEAIAALAGSNPVYFANGNLFYDSGSKGWHIDPVTKASNNTATYGIGTLSNGLFSCGDPTGADPSIDDDDFPSAHISGTSYDIAHVNLDPDKIGTISGWRLPTALEFAFLIEELTKNAGDAGRYHWINGYASTVSAFYNLNGASPWQGVISTNPTKNGNEGLIINSILTNNEIFLPATGIGQKSGYPIIAYRSNVGYYWSGSFHSTGHARSLYAASNSISQYYNQLNFCFAVRPVWE